MEKLGCHWTDFHSTVYLNIFRISIEKIQVSLKSDKNNGYLTRIPGYIYGISLKREMSQTKVVEKFKTRILCPVTFFKIENRVDNEILWENVVERGRFQMTI